MGFYDCLCMITGVSLHGVDATAVVLRREDDTYRPITLGIAGTYDRYGSIDGIAEDTHTDLVLSYFRDRLRDGRFVVDTEYLKIEPDEPFTDIEELLWCFERNNLCFDDFPGTPDHLAALDGAAVVSALIAQPVWDALAATATPAGGSAPAGDVYGDRWAEVSELARQFSAVNEFVVANGLVWAPPAEPSQRYPTGYGGQYEMGEFLDEARRDYRDVPVVRAALDEYERIASRY